MAQPKRRGVNDATESEAQRLNVRIDPATHQRLMIHCVMAGMTPGKLIADLVNRHCREWRVQANRTGSVTTDDRLEVDAGVSLATPVAAAG
jgi:hypothetical protein